MRPNKNDHIAYFERYINLVSENDILSALKNNHEEILAFITSIPKNKSEHKYAEDKWTVKQVINHINDTERIFSYRALRFSRGDAQLLPGFDENLFAANANLSTTDLDFLAEEFDTVRKATILQFRQLSDKELLLKGKVTLGETNVLSLGYMICGHATHHKNIIEERYL
ncbi:MAG: DinB family protein [Bacteroidetes bacterium]|nr:DinB family protein [Bacteroidota bacterium]